jgi:tryptophan synthase beta subunit
MLDDAVAPRDYGAFPDERGHFGPYGGTFVAETLIEPLAELARAYAEARTPSVCRRRSAARRSCSSART